MSKYICGDEVSFKLEGTTYKGNVFIIDEYGTFENPGEVSYDVLCDNTLIKHIPESILL